MANITTEILDFLGVNYVPIDFPGFMVWFCSLLAGLWFIKFVLNVTFGFVYKAMRINER